MSGKDRVSNGDIAKTCATGTDFGVPSMFPDVPRLFPVEITVNGVHRGLFPMFHETTVMCAHEEFQKTRVANHNWEPRNSGNKAGNKAHAYGTQ